MSIFAIDFDGTITDSHFPEFGNIRPDASRVIQRLVMAGQTVIIWTCRPINGHGIEEMEKWLEENGVPYHGINENARALKFSTSQKIYADIYIDDRSIDFCENGVDWNVLEGKLEKLGFLKDKNRYKGKGRYTEENLGLVSKLIRKLGS